MDTQVKIFINLDPPYIRFTRRQEEKSYVHRELTVEEFRRLLLALGVLTESSSLPKREFIAAGEFMVEQATLRGLGLLCELGSCDCVGLACAWTGCAADHKTGRCACEKKKK